MRGTERAGRASYEIGQVDELRMNVVQITDCHGTRRMSGRRAAVSPTLGLGVKGWGRVLLSYWYVSVRVTGLSSNGERAVIVQWSVRAFNTMNITAYTTTHKSECNCHTLFATTQPPRQLMLSCIVMHAHAHSSLSGQRSCHLFQQSI